MRDAIGVFDSGIGGLTVLREIHREIPDEHTIYLGDTARVPYGTRSPETVIRYSLQAGRFLAEKQVKLLVVACHTSSSVGLAALQAAHPPPRLRVLGVIDPSVREALRVTRTRRVGIIGTEATIRSEAYTHALKQLDPEVQVFTKACPLFVPIAEEGWEDSDVAALTAERYLRGFRELGIDTLILGCTHYPMLREVIARTLGESIQLIDAGEATARAVREFLKSEGRARLASADAPRSAGGGSPARTLPARGAEHLYYVTDAHERFVKVGSRFLGRDLAGVITVEL
jgi:glutamate racemase